MYTKQMLEERWGDILEYMKNNYNISEVSYRTWLQPLKIYDLEDNIVTLLVDDTVVHPIGLAFIRNRYGFFFKTAIEEVIYEDFEVEFVSKSQIQKQDDERKHKERFQSSGFSRLLNPLYTFDSFVVGDNNSNAHAAALAVAEQPGEILYNPLYIYGGPGLGKTHLMYSIANYIMEHNPELKVLYITSETFTNELVNAIRSGSGSSNSLEEFRKKYRSNDVLLIDDIQFIINKERTQEEFFHTFNEMRDSGRQVIISSDKHPKNLQILDERLRSRLEWGFTVDVQPPVFETRMAILRKKAEQNRLTIDNEILVYIADNIRSNIRELEGALTKVVALGRLQNRKITMELAEEALKDYISPEMKKTVTLPFILEVVAEQYGITSDQLLSKNKSRNIAYPRQIAMYLCREFTTLSFDEIGKAIGNRDHSTVHYAYGKVQEDIENDPNIASAIEVLKKKINIE
ncbi:MAG: chromosomal replication initiator protein DnaA [Lachnospiraceae bacterium]|jgi:chromosomal replication initiator protein|nr:chromosomal replication initiator protein DnaA [Lachnospiraceae bacterium]